MKKGRGNEFKKSKQGHMGGFEIRKGKEEMMWLYLGLKKLEKQLELKPFFPRE